MSVLIPGMEMPTSCYKCPVNKDDGFGYFTCGVTHSECDFMDLPADCPLIPVPDHGRMIDADAYRAEMKKRQDACAEWRDEIKSGGGYGTELYYRTEGFLGAMCEAKLTLDKMPTIIPADPAEEGEG